MSTFFEIRPNSKIGFKLLTQPDLGLRESSHQTHIGLFQDTFEFLSKETQSYSAKFIFQQQSFDLDCTIGFINSNRSPNIKSGGRNLNQVVNKIRETVKKVNKKSDWFLIWFGLTNEELAFYLFERGSVEYNQIIKFIPEINSPTISMSRGRLEPGTPSYKLLLEYLQVETDVSNSDYLQSLEILAQIGNFDSQGPVNETVLRKIKKYRRLDLDLDTAKRKQKETGEKGELLINDYLSKLKDKKEIKGFVWENESKESYLPYDFKIETSSEDIFMDVKTTSYKFEQSMVFSRNELRLAYDSKSYHVYRVFDINKVTSPSLRICRDLKSLSKTLVDEVEVFEKKIKNSYQGISSIKFEISPDNPSLIFDGKIAI
jgi:hypothetical protein